MRMRKSFGVVLVCFLAAPAARAADGVIEINQTRALAGGVTASDTPGFPVTISTPGSFVLTSDLTVSSTSANGIEVLVSDVSIDLGGFTIAGPVTCTGLGSALTCTPAASNRGITGSGAERIRVEHGNVRGFGSYGIYIGANSSIRSVVAASNGSSGIRTSQNSELLDCQTVQNHSTGITTAGTTIVSRSVSKSNFSHGMYGSGYGVSFTDNIAEGNGGSGIVTTLQATIRNNLARANGTNGIDVSSGSLVHDNLASDNAVNGIVTGSGSSVQHNNVYSNSATGMVLGTGTGYRENVIHGNTTATVSGGVSMGNNLCDGTSTCP